MTKIVRTETRQRSIAGKLIKWVFILFNLVMIIWLTGYWMQISDMSGTSSSDAEKAGVAIGGTIGTGMLLSLWVAGDFILGILVLFTRGKKTIVEESVR